MATTAAALAPALTPMMSGLASGLRRVALEDGAAAAERHPDQHPEHRPGQLLSISMKVAPGISAPPRIRKKSGTVMMKLPSSTRATKAERGPPPGQRPRRRGAVAGPPGLAYDVDGPGGFDRGCAHRPAIRPRRSNNTKNGYADDSRHDADLHLGGRQHDPAHASATAASAAPAATESGSTACSWDPTRARTACGTTRPTKAIGPTRAVAVPVEQHHRDPDADPVQTGPPAEPAWRGRRRARARPGPGHPQRHHGSDGEERSTTSEVEPSAADGADLPLPEDLQPLAVHQQDAAGPAGQRRGQRRAGEHQLQRGWRHHDRSRRRRAPGSRPERSR